MLKLLNGFLCLVFPIPFHVFFIFDVVYSRLSWLLANLTFPPVIWYETNSVVVYTAVGSRSTKGASKQRRDAINERVSQIRELLPVSEAARSRLSQLQVMALARSFIAKSNLFNRQYKLYRYYSHSGHNFVRIL